MRERSRWGRAVVIGLVGTTCALLLGGAACQPTPATPLCGLGRGGQPGSLLSADGDHVVYLSDSTDLGPDANSTACDVFVRTLSTGVVERVSAEETAVGAPEAISADGRLVLYPVGGVAKLVDVASGEVLWSVPTPLPRAVDLTPDGRYVAWADGLDVLRLDRTTGDVEEIASGAPAPPGGGAAINSVSISDAGSVVAVGAWSGLYTWDLAAGAVQQHDAARSVRVELSPDGSTIAREVAFSADVVSQVSLIDRATGAVTELEASRALASMAWSVEGSWVVYTSANQNLAGDPTGLDPRELGAQQVYARRVRDQRVVRLYQPGLFGWPNGPTFDVAFTATDHNPFNSPRDRQFQVVALEP